jgi:hypothetical protein
MTYAYDYLEPLSKYDWPQQHLIKCDWSHSPLIYSISIYVIKGNEKKSTLMFSGRSFTIDPKSGNSKTSTGTIISK